MYIQAGGNGNEIRGSGMPGVSAAGIRVSLWIRSVSTDLSPPP